MTGLSLIFPVYDDDNMIAKVINDIENKFNEHGLRDYEFLVFLDPGVSKLTTQFLKEISANNQKIRVFERQDSIKIGLVFLDGIKKAHKDRVAVWSAYDQISPDSFDFILPVLNKYDVVITYVKNPEARRYHRRLLSALNVFLLNLLFGLDMCYYHLAFFKTKLAAKVNVKSNMHSAMGEVLVTLTKSGATFIQVPFIMIPHNFPSKSHALDFYSILYSVGAYLRLFVDIRLLGRKIEQ